jgi:transposase
MNLGKPKTANKISKREPKYLRWALYVAAVACIKHNAEFRALYHKKISQGKNGKQTLVYVAKKLAHLCLSMLKSGEAYKPERIFTPA